MVPSIEDAYMCVVPVAKLPLTFTAEEAPESMSAALLSPAGAVGGRNVKDDPGIVRFEVIPGPTSKYPPPVFMLVYEALDVGIEPLGK